MTSIAIFASGNGSNARKIIDYFRDHDDIAVRLVISNKADALVLAAARAEHIETKIVERSYFYETEQLLTALRDRNIDFIVLAGFLWKVPRYLVQAFERKIVNIHPALLPNFGGKGMYGSHVHEAVKASGVTQTGITIHYANENYDEGDIIFQATCAVLQSDTAADIARKVLELEHRYFSKTIEEVIRNKK